MTTRKSAVINDVYEILLDIGAKRDLDNLSSPDFNRINRRILSLSNNPRPRGCKKLGDDVYRVRVGPWRIIYVIDDSRKKVIISRVRRREKDTYRNI